MSKDKIASKLVFFSPSSYILRGWVSVFSVILIALAHFSGFSSTMVLFLYIIAFFWGGELFIRGALRELAKKYIGFNAFVSLSALSAFVFSVLNNFDGLPVIAVSGDVLIIPIIFSMANFIKAKELKYIGCSFRFIESLENFISRSALRVEGKEEKKVFIKEIKIGDTILIKTGERIPLDGEIIKGSTLVDEHLLTGNITLAAKQKGDKVYAASINKGGEILVKAGSLKNTSRIAKVLEAVKENEKKKLICPSILENYSSYVMLFFIVVALAQFAYGMYFDKYGNIEYWLILFFFILSISGPISFMAAVLLPAAFVRSGALNHKIKINNLTALNILKDSTKIFIDKTGTLTTGKLEVSEIETAPDIKKSELIKAAFTAQQGADNIFAGALSEYALKERIKADKVVSMELYPSFGSVVKTAKDKIVAGRKAWLKDLGIEVPGADQEIKKTVFYVAKNDKFLGAIYFTDRLRANAKSTVAYLKKRGKSVALLSGDSRAAIEAVAQKAGIEEFYGDMFPQDKAAKISSQINLGENVTMIGDSFNDILALLQADTSVAFSSDKNAFSSWVDFAVGSRDFDSIRKIFELDARQNSTARQNILISVLFSLMGVYGVLILKYPAAWYHIIGLLLAAVFVIILNSVRLKK